MSTAPITGSCIAGRPCLLMARVLVNDNGTSRPVVKADLDEITYKVWNRGVQVGADGVLDKIVVIYDTLQTGTTWLGVVDGTGGNFAFTLAGTYVPDPCEIYTVTVTFTLTGGEEFDVEFEIGTLDSKG